MSLGKSIPSLKISRIRRYFGALAVGLITVVLDYFFHLAFTSPMEVLAYFVAKFLIAFGVAYLILPLLGPTKTAVVYSFAFSVLYYGVGLYVLHLPGLSVWEYGSGINFTLVGIPITLPTFGILEFFVHALVFGVAALIVGRIRFD